MNTIEQINAAQPEASTDRALGRTHEDFQRHVGRRNRRLRVRRLLRGATGVAAILLIWQVVSQVLDLELLLPPPINTTLAL